MPCGSTIEPRTIWSACLAIDAQPHGDLDRLIELRVVELLEHVDGLGDRQRRLAGALLGQLAKSLC